MEDFEMYGKGWIVGTIAVVLAVVLIGFVLSIRIIDQSKTCAVVVLGKVQQQPASVGFQLVRPLITRMACFSSQQALYQAVTDAKGNADFMDFPVEIKTSDGQTAFVEYNIIFSVKPENVVMVRSFVAQNMNDVVSRVIANYSRSVTRDIAPKYSASQLYTTGRVDYEKEVEGALRVKFLENGITLGSFQLRDVNFDPDYETAIEQQQIERERIETNNFKAQSAVYEAQRTAELAKGDAQATIEHAKGDAEAVRINALAESEAIALKGEALKKNPLVLSLEFIQNLAHAQWMMVPWNEIQGYLPLQPGAQPTPAPTTP